jgi:diaminopimelate epimerase
MSGESFFKYEGLGNDFIVVDLRQMFSAGPDDADSAVHLCDRHFGVGADGLLVLLPPSTPGAIATMRVWNADGSIAEMCGNGLRCVAKHLRDQDSHGSAEDRLVIDTGNGPLSCQVFIGEDGLVDSVAVDMGVPELGRQGHSPTQMLEPWSHGGRDLELTYLSMGNPHAVAFVDDTGAALRQLAERSGPHLEASVPGRLNAEFAHLMKDGSIELVVWERGCGLTLACGTGACATAVAATLLGHAPRDREITVHLPGGDLAITVGDRVSMRGPARLVFTGTLS